MNRENILKVAQRIENAEVDQFHMGAWFGEITEPHKLDWEENDLQLRDDQFCISPKFGNKMEDHIDINMNYRMHCGTTACIAGWACIDLYANDNSQFKELKIRYSPFLENLNIGSIPEIAADYLGLTEKESHRLFFCYYDSIWIQLKEEYDLNIDPENNATWSFDPKTAADVLRRIASGQIKL